MSARSPLPRIVVALGVVSLLTDVSSEMILPLLPGLILGTMGGGPIIVGLVDGISDALAAVLKLVAGNLSDKFPKRKPFVLAGYGLSAVVRPLVALATAPWHVIAVRAADRVGKGLRSAPRDALIGDAVARDDAPRAYAFHRMMDHTGAVAGPLVAAALLYAGLSAHEAIAAAWVPGALAVLALALFVDERPREVAQDGDRRAGAGAAATPPLKLPPSVLAPLVVFGLFTLGLAGDSFLLVRAHDLHVDAPLLPMLWSVLHVAKVIAARQVGRYNASSTWWIVGAWCAVAGGLALLTIDDARVVWLAAVVVGLGHGVREPIERALVRQRAPDAVRGRAFGAYHLVTGLGALPAGLAIGVIWQQASGEAALLTSTAVVLFAAAALALTRRWW